MANNENRPGFGDWGVKQALIDFAKQVKSKNQRKGKKYKERRRGNSRKLQKLEVRENNNNLPRVGISDFEDGEFYGLRNDFEQRKEKFKKN